MEFQCHLITFHFASSFTFITCWFEKIISQIINAYSMSAWNRAAIKKASRWSIIKFELFYFAKIISVDPTLKFQPFFAEHFISIHRCEAQSDSFGVCKLMNSDELCLGEKLSFYWSQKCEKQLCCEVWNWEKFTKSCKYVKLCIRD